MGDVIPFPTRVSVFRDAAGWMRYGRRCEEESSLDEAETAYATAAFIDPARSEAWEGMARLQARQGRLAEAEQTVMRAIAHAAGSSGLLAWLADLLEARGRRVEARRLRERAGQPVDE